MKLLCVFLLLSSAAAAQDTLHLSANQEQVLKALVEKGFSIKRKSPQILITDPHEIHPYGTSGRNELLLRLTFFFTEDGSNMIGEYCYNFRYQHMGDKYAWIPVTNDKVHKFSWGKVNEFAKYLADEVSQK